MSNIATIYYNDVSAAPGFSVSVYFSGCSKEPHCPGCHNPEAWDFDFGSPLTQELTQKIIAALNANGVMRNLCIFGGEPMCKENIGAVIWLIDMCRTVYPGLKVYVWSGYTYEELRAVDENTLYGEDIRTLLEIANYLIDGPFIAAQRDITLKMRGSANQRIIDLRQTEKENKIIEIQ